MVFSPGITIGAMSSKFISSVILLGVQKMELYWVVYCKHFYIKDLKHSHEQDLKDKPSIWLHIAYQV